MLDLLLHWRQQELYTDFCRNRIFCTVYRDAVLIWSGVLMGLHFHTAWTPHLRVNIRRSWEKPLEFMLIINTNGYTHTTSLQILISIQWSKPYISVKQMLLPLLSRWQKCVLTFYDRTKHHCQAMTNRPLTCLFFPLPVKMQYQTLHC